MTVKDLIGLINESHFLSEKRRELFIGALPKIEIEKIKKLAQILLWAKEQKNLLEQEKNLVLGIIAEIFAAMNIKASMEAKKETVNLIEKEMKKREREKEDKLLNELKDA